ncbi:hypothetical protein [Paenibacillus sp. O199]|uniref:hypothetical protein n=1 Tax=Paenibacillus sp. O199 TaxID=1643925 RepID=UPI000B294303|nr:hypothetical protein [Paenibacillus sp. O199]
MEQNWLEDYMKFKSGITPLGIVMYPVVALVIAFLIVSMYSSRAFYWVKDRIKKK